MPYTLLKHQQKPADELLAFLKDPHRKGVLLLGATGVGKTYVLANAIRRAQEEGLYLANKESRPLQFFNNLLLTPKRAITQQRRVFYREGVKDFEVNTHSAMTSSFGELCIDWVSEYRRGELDKVPVWNKDSIPDVIFVDEVQLVKNRNSARTKVIHAAIKQGVKCVFISATPFSKACEAETVVCGCGLVSFDNFNHYANDVAPYGIDRNYPAAIKRIKADLLARNAIIEIKGARYPFKPDIKNALLDLTPEKRVIYQQAYNEYLAEIAKEGRRGPQGIRAIWVAQNKFREAGDILKSDLLAARAFQVVNYAACPRQVIIASNFVAALNKIWTNLVKIHSVNPSKISVLFGGQTDDVAQRNIDNFQEGKTDYFLTTMKSGGTSISLHHELQYPGAKPRYVLIPPTWSVYEMVQILGRAQRITSASQTIQEITWYRDTIEEKVAERVGEKFDCLKELVDRSESFIHNIFNQNAEIDQQAMAEVYKAEAGIGGENEDEYNEGIDTGMFGESNNENEN